MTPGPVGALGRKGRGVGRGTGGAAVAPEIPDAVVISVTPSFGSTAGGGTLSVAGTGFQSGDVIRIDGTNRTTAFVDSAQLTCTAPAHAAGVVNVVVRRGAEDSNAVTYEFVADGDVPADMIFASSWDDSTGQGNDALSDGGKWTRAVTNGLDSVEVAAVGLANDFPMANVFHVEADDVNAGGSAAYILRVSGLLGTSDGDDRFYRVYFEYLVPDDRGSGSPHPIQDGLAISNSNWAIGCQSSLGQTNWDLRMYTPGTSIPNNVWWLRGLTKGATYIIEVHIHRISSTTFNLHMRVSDKDGNLLYSDANFVNGNGTVLLSTNPTLTFHDVAVLTQIQAGTNGAFQAHGGDAGAFPIELCRYSGLAIRTGDWCGTFNAGEADL